MLAAVRTCAVRPRPDDGTTSRRSNWATPQTPHLTSCFPPMYRYNIINFDLPYLLDRAAALKSKGSKQLNGFPYLGRLKGFQTRMKDKMFQSKQVGTRESKEINIEGRVQFDVLSSTATTPHTRRPARPRSPRPSHPTPSTSPGAPARLQAVIILAQRGVRPLPRRAEGGRPPQHHLRPPGGERRHAPPPRRHCLKDAYLPQTRRHCHHLHHHLHLHLHLHRHLPHPTFPPPRSGCSKPMCIINYTRWRATGASRTSSPAASRSR